MAETKPAILVPTPNVATYMFCYRFTCIRFLLTEPHRPPIAREPQFELVSVTDLKAEFTSLLMTIVHILSSCPNQQANLQRCKDHCLLILKASDGSDDSIFSAKLMNKIKECENFKQLIETVSDYISWDEHSILTHIALQCESDEGQKEIQKFDQKLGMCEGLQLIASEASTQLTLSIDFMTSCVIINKPYNSITIEEYENVKTYIYSNLKINPFETSRFINMLYNPLQSKVNKQIGNEVVINDEVCTYVAVYVKVCALLDSFTKNSICHAAQHQEHVATYTCRPIQCIST